MSSAERRWTSVAAALLAALVASLLLSAQASADAREDALAQYNALQSDLAVGSGWTGSTDPCNVGTESQASLDATRDAVNILRNYAGVTPVTFSAAKNEQALKAALIMRAQGDLSHDPPGSWKCWTQEGHDAAGASNLYLGASGAEAMVGYVNDAGVDSLGHRRWLLDPETMEMGSGSTGSSNALVVIGGNGDGSAAAALPTNKLVGWPSAGWFPSTMIFEDWTVAIGNAASADTVSLAGAQVNVKVDGKGAAVSNIASLGTGPAPGRFVGTGSTLTWRVALPASMAQGDHDIDVSISGVTMGGSPFPVSYTVKAFDPTKAGPADPGGGGGNGSAACEKATKKLAKAKKKLQKAKDGGKPAKIKKAKKKVKKAKAKKKDACK